MKKIFIVLALFLAGVMVFQTEASAARKSRAAKIKHADKNKDGVVDKKEKHMEKKWEEKKRSEANTWWEKRADTNNDGVVDGAELNQWKALEKERLDLNADGKIDPKERRTSWRHARCRVNTATEQKYDTNSDGWLETEEVRKMLMDRTNLIKVTGRAKVDSVMEEEYDMNRDGIIDHLEAEALKEDLE